MAATVQTVPEAARVKRLNFFERYLTVWVGLCIFAGLALGKLTPALVGVLRRMEFGRDSQVNMPIAVLIWLMRKLKIDTEVEPGRTTDVTINPDTAGTYTTICDHFCGANHGNMKMTIVVE